MILIFSIFFYAWGGSQFIVLLLFSLTANFYLVEFMAKRDRYQKLYFSLSLAINIGILLYFKYANFFIENVNAALHQFGIHEIEWTKVLLPIGISFFTFQSITYTIDVNRRVHQPLKKLSDYLLYILMFPQLIAGPIVRFNTIADEIIDRDKNETVNNKLNGIYIFIIGLSKKILIANVLGEYVDTNFSSSISEMGTATLWLTIISYSFQIYFDFSGYSDMAIGLGRMIGFKFPENFNNPYISQNITEFWRRWHITLGEWMKDYLYIPLGGNRVSSTSRLYANLITVFLISGLWHGAEWTFLIWGAWHGVFLILDRIFLIRLFKRTGKVPRIAFTFVIVLIGWVFFRSESLTESFVFLKGMFIYRPSESETWLENFFIFILLIAALFSFSGITRIGRSAELIIYKEKNSIISHSIFFGLSFVFLIICTSYITSSGFNPFIYFRF